MDKSRSHAELKIGLFGIGLDAYWPQFPGLEDRLKGYGRQVADQLEKAGAHVVNLGLSILLKRPLLPGISSARPMSISSFFM